MKTFKEFLTEAKIDTTERDDKIKSYLEKKYDIKSKKNINVFITGLANSFGIHLTVKDGENFISYYDDMIALNKSIDDFLKNEKIPNVESFRGFLPYTQFDINDRTPIIVSSKVTKKIIKDAGGVKNFNDKYGEGAAKILDGSFDLSNTTIPNINKKGSFDIVLPKGTINIPSTELKFAKFVHYPAFSVGLNYDLSKNIGIAKKISNVEMDLFKNDVENIIDLLNNITIKLEGGEVRNNDLLILSSDLTKASIKVRKTIKSYIKSQINTLKNEYKESNEKDLISTYVSNLKSLLSRL